MRMDRLYRQTDRQTYRLHLKEGVFVSYPGPQLAAGSDSNPVIHQLTLASLSGLTSLHFIKNFVNTGGAT